MKILDDVEILGKYKAIWTTIEDFKNIKLNLLPVYDRYIKTKIRTCSIEVYTNFCGLNVLEDYAECESMWSCWMYLDSKNIETAFPCKELGLCP